MKTWSFKLKALDKNGNIYDHVVTASTSFVRDMYNRFFLFLRDDYKKDTFTTRSNIIYESPLIVKKNSDGTFTFKQEGSEWNFTTTRDQVIILDSECEMFSLMTPPNKTRIPSGKQIGDYLHAIDKGDDGYIEWFNGNFYG